MTLHRDRRLEATLLGDVVITRDSADPNHGIKAYTRGEWAAGLRFYQKLWGRGVAGRDAPNANQRRPDEP